MNVRSTKISEQSPGAAPAPFRAEYGHSEYGHFTGGEWVASTGGGTTMPYTSANDQEMASIQAGTPSDINRAAAGARGAVRAWLRSKAAERRKLVLEIGARLKRRHVDRRLRGKRLWPRIFI
jgi:hypothetical protein